MIFKQEVKKAERNRVFFDIEKVLEYKLPNIYNHGFIDLAILINLHRIKIGTNYFNFIVKKSKDNFEEGKFYFEIKPTIKSIGETMRQINYYRAYLGKGDFILVTKTKGLKKIFKTQGVNVYEYE